MTDVDRVEEFDQGFSQRHWNDDLFVIAHNSVDDVEVVPTVVVVGVDSLKVFWGSPYQGVSYST